MKVAFWHFYTFRMLRGIETLVTSLGNALSSRGIDVSLIAAEPDGRPLVQPDAAVSVHTYPTFRYFEHQSIVPFYVQHFIRHRYDHVVVFFADFGEGTAWRILNSVVDLPITLYLCYPYSAVPHRYDSFVRLGWHRRAKHILADGPWIAREAEALFQRSVDLVPAATDPHRFCPNPALRARWRRDLGFESEDLILLSASALEPRKGVQRAIQAVARLRTHFPHIKYLVLGKGESEGQLRALAASAGVQDRVLFGGTTSQLEAFYNLADIFVMLPDAEGNSVACHEAMSCELPVVVSNSEAFVASVPSNAGLLVEPSDQDEIVHALTRLSEDPALRRSMGKAGRRHILESRTWDHSAARFLEALS